MVNILGQKALTKAMRFLVFAVCIGITLGSESAKSDTVSDDSMRRAISEYLASGASLPLSIKAYSNGLNEYYVEQKGPMLWTQPAKLEAFVKTLSASRQDGLSPSDYALDHIRTLQGTLHSKDARLRAWLELSYSSFLIRYAQDLGSGRILPTKIAPDIFVERTRTPSANILNAFRNSGTLQDFSISQMPADVQYKRLREKLGEYQLITDGGGWPTVPGGSPLKLGSKGKRVERLRVRLEFTADVDYMPQNRDFFDENMVQAVNRFQSRLGIKQSGVVTKRVILALNIPASDRLRQIEVNMERWRWIRDVQNERVLTVNLANNSFRFTVADKLVQETRLQHRKSNAKMPVLDDQVSSITVRSSDIVPPEIAGPAYFELASKNPKKIAEQGVEVFFKGRNVPAEAVDWASYSEQNFPFTMRRPVRKGDPAGYVRLVFSNNDATCLSGTVPQKRSNKVDKFAPDCLTFVRADEFANALLRQNSQSLDAILANEKRQHGVYSSPFDQPIPVRILYATAWVDDDGALHFRPDVAHRDLKLFKALKGRHSPR